ncbi:MAG TPA: hypothetical protein VN132_04975, partial [Bdellovibrio sp.]|nr:hypothetical protein [Bdellovibrio sp.]
MKYLYWFAAAVVIALGVYLSTHISLEPQSISKIEFTQVSIPEEFGKMIFERVRREVKQAPIIFVGVTPGQIEDLELWRGFFEANQEPGSRYDVIVVESMLPYVEIFNNGMHLPIKEDMTRLVDGIQKARAQGLRVAVIGPHIYSSQLIKNNPVFHLKVDYKVDVTSFTVTKFPLTRDQEEHFEPKCIDGGAVDPAGTS